MRIPPRFLRLGEESTKVLLLAVSLEPFEPFNIAGFAIASLIAYREGAAATLALIAAYMVLHIASPILAIAVVAILVTAIRVLERRLTVSIIGLLLLLLLTALAIRSGMHTFFDSYRALLVWVSERGSSGIVPLYLAASSNAVLMYLASRYAPKSLKENPGSAPAILFMLLLINAAIVLALGNEVHANKLAELAYYSLVIAVCAQLVDVVRSRQ